MDFYWHLDDAGLNKILVPTWKAIFELVPIVRFEKDFEDWCCALATSPQRDNNKTWNYSCCMPAKRFQGAQVFH